MNSPTAALCSQKSSTQIPCRLNANTWSKRKQTKRCEEEVQVIGKVVVEVPDQVSKVVHIEDILNDGDTKCKGLPWKKPTFVSTVGKNSTNQQNKTTWKSSMIEAKSLTTIRIKS